MMGFIKKQCKICCNNRKFLRDTPRDKESICGECWDWEADEKIVDLEKDAATE